MLGEVFYTIQSGLDQIRKNREWIHLFFLIPVPYNNATVLVYNYYLVISTDYSSLQFIIIRFTTNKCQVSHVGISNITGYLRNVNKLGVQLFIL